MSKPNCDCLAPLYRRFEAGEDPERVMPWDIDALSDECAVELCMMYLKYGGTKRAKYMEDIIRVAGRKNDRR